MNRERWSVRAGWTARRTLSLLLDGVVGVVLFTWVVTGLSLSAGLAITLLGIPLLAVVVQSGRVIGAVERARVRVLLGVEVPAPAASERPSGVWPWVRAALADVPGWKGLAYGVVMLFWGVLAFSLTLMIWTVGLGLLTAPLWEWAMPEAQGVVTSFELVEFVAPVWVGVPAGMVVGAGVLFIAPRIVGRLVGVQVALVRALLSVDRRAALQQRVGELQLSRSASVDAAEAERRRIERDLHDGTQQQLVGVAIDLGIARERLADIDDEQSRELVERAHEGLKEAIAELRDLVRGIHPAVLTDRGLDAAVSALAARSAIPVEVRSGVQRRLPGAVESAAYFVVAEALTNAIKHSDASRVTVTIREDGAMLVIEVADDGCGGALVAPTGGLHGMEDRVCSLDGRVEITSPAGGPTTLRVVIPCGS